MIVNSVVAAAMLLAASAQTLSYAQEYRYQDNRYPAPQNLQAPPPQYPPQAQPQAPSVFQDMARVTRVTPRIEQVNSPQEQCRMEVERVEAPAPGRSIAGALIGGVAGGILGNQVGGGSGRTAATALGAVGGALVGDNVGNQNAHANGPIERQVRRCTMVNQTVERPAGYEVQYSYQGRNYSTIMPNNPGNNIRVNVSVAPAY